MALAATADSLEGATLPPGPRLPPFVQTLLWIYRPTWFMERYSRLYPGMVRVQLAGAPPFILLTDPVLIAKVFALGGDVAAAGKANGILRPLLGDESVLLLDGPRHARERRLLMPPFHGERMRAYAETMRALTEQTLDALPQGEVFPLHRVFQQLTLQIILKVVLGLSDGPETQALRVALAATLEGVLTPRTLFVVTPEGKMRAPGLQKLLGPLAPAARLKRDRENTDALLFEELRRRRAQLEAQGGGSTRDDILSLLLSARDEDGQPMSDVQLRDELLTLLTAGHETTATALTWTIAELLQNPHVMARAKEELAREVGQGPLEAAHLPKLKYLDAVITESLRLRPVIPVVARYLEKPVSLGGCDLPAHVAILPCVYLTHRLPELYPEPSQFKPERFLEQTPDPASYFPFGGGARRCIGRAFALMEMKVVLAQTLRQVELKLSPSYEMKLVRRAITFAPSEGLPVVRA